ncbi:MAG TPA: hypothetical protein VEA80_06725 [Vitreimonas sp.]|uniref:hypothetical protein n=1 Tax=Vitreimonas sp. TaxID=3069702 RepID=UPI002D49A415|nr:hypothetical protein [Vitreimonas sp.]HYD87148.1 hypothetical protein [Vitreimonas sp.]
MLARPPVWQRLEQAPPDIENAALAATITCDCGRGGKIVVTGSRVAGEWIVMCEHSIELTHFMILPRHPNWGCVQ